MPLRVRSLTMLAFLLASAACAGSRQAEPDPVPVVPPCDRTQVIVQGAGAGADGIGRFVASGVGCDAPRDTLVLGALDRLLFVGVPESPQSAAMLADPVGARRNPSGALQLLRGRDGLQYVLQQTEATDGGTLFRIDLAGLRAWLERNGLARRFGLP